MILLIAAGAVLALLSGIAKAAGRPTRARRAGRPVATTAGRLAWIAAIGTAALAAGTGSLW